MFTKFETEDKYFFNQNFESILKSITSNVVYKDELFYPDNTKFRLDKYLFNDGKENKPKLNEDDYAFYKSIILE